MTSNHYPYNNVELCLLADVSWLTIDSPKRLQFLQGQLSCDMNTVTTHHSRFSFHCNPKGQVISSFRVFEMTDHYRLRLNKDLVTLTKNALDKYGLLFQAAITPCSDWQVLAIAGQHAEKLLLNHLEEVPTHINETLSTSKLQIVKISDTPRFEIYGDHDAIHLLHQKLAPYTNEMTPTAWRHWDIEECFPALYSITSERFIPHRLGYHHWHTIDWDKGCFTGQEVIARTQYRSQKQFNLHRMTVDNAYAPGDTLHPDSSSTKITVLESTPQKQGCLILACD